MSIVFENDENLKNIPNNIIDTDLILKIDIKLKDFSKIVKNAVKMGYKYPILSTKFLTNTFSIPYLFLYNKYNHNYSKVDKNYKKILKDVNFCIENYIKTENTKNINCSSFIVFDKYTINYLHGYTKKYKFSFENTIEQREISGKFLLRPINDKTLKVELDENFSGVGGKEDVNAISTIASFHTHPLEAYQRYNVCIAWPSVDDLIAFFSIYLDGYGIFHVVSTLEGLYIVTISDEMLKKDINDLRKDYLTIEKFIKENYRFEYPVCDIKNKTSKNIWREKIEEYLAKTKNLPYFNIKFREWNDLKSPIEINYKRDNGNCLINDEQIRFKQLYM
jgi:hypothetical protein